MSVEVIVPFAGDCPYRKRALDYVTARYPWPVTISPGSRMGDRSAVTSGSGRTEDGASRGVWIKADAVMPAAEATNAEIVVVADADCWSEGVTQAVEAVAEGAAWAMPHRGVLRLTEAATERFLAGEPPEGLPLEERAYLGWEGGGIVVARRETVLAVPMDRRFVGWGCEDESWALALSCLAGRPVRIKQPLIHLWHPPQPREDRRQGNPTNFALLRRYVAARRDPAAMRSLLDEVPRDDRTAHQSPLHDHAGRHL